MSWPWLRLPATSASLSPEACSPTLSAQCSVIIPRHHNVKTCHAETGQLFLPSHTYLSTHISPQLRPIIIMLVESGSGKSGRAFEYVMEAPEEGDFVLIGNNGHVVTRRGPPRRLSVGLARLLTNNNPHVHPPSHPSFPSSTHAHVLILYGTRSITRYPSRFNSNHSRPTHPCACWCSCRFAQLSHHAFRDATRTIHVPSFLTFIFLSRRWPHATCISHCTYISILIIVLGITRSMLLSSLHTQT